MVQARWGHLNRDCSLLTEAQALFLDGHFADRARGARRQRPVLQLQRHRGRLAARVHRGRRRLDARHADRGPRPVATARSSRAGASSSAPTSSRPAELPVDIRAFKAQQRRWAKGSIQTARKILPTLFRQAPLPLSVKLEAVGPPDEQRRLRAAHRLDPPARAGAASCPTRCPRAISLALLTLSFVTGMVAVVVFLLAARRAVGGRMRSALSRLPRTLLLGVGMSLNNAVAVLEAFRPRARRMGTDAEGRHSLAARCAAAHALSQRRGLGRRGGGARRVPGGAHRPGGRSRALGGGSVPRLPDPGVRLCGGPVLARAVGADLTPTATTIGRKRRILSALAASPWNRKGGPDVSDTGRGDASDDRKSPAVHVRGS